MGVLDALFPKKCLNCSKGAKYICRDCLEKLPNPTQTCPMCQKPSIDGITHTKCEKKWGINSTYSIFSYSGVIRKAVLNLKYNYASDIISELVAHSVTKLREDNIFPNKLIFIPIPLYWYKENVRGFNQSFSIGELIATKMRWKYRSDILIRKMMKKSQSVLKKEERNKNIRGVFMPNSGYQLPRVNYLLFDDVYTTGSTLKEAAKVLKRRGARNVWGLTIAK